jgi:predicted kinase
VRISLDLLKTRNKEQRFLQLCLETGQKFVIDNTNPTIVNRARYIEAAKLWRFHVVGYYFNTRLEAAIMRNSQRTGREVVSTIGLKATQKKLQPPTLSEHFDELFEVTLVNHSFQTSKI